MKTRNISITTRKQLCWLGFTPYYYKSCGSILKLQDPMCKMIWRDNQMIAQGSSPDQPYVEHFRTPMEPLLLPEHNPSSMEPRNSRFVPMPPIKPATCFAGRETLTAWVIHYAGFRESVFYTQLMSTESWTAVPEMIAAAQALVLEISDFDLNGQVNSNSFRVAHLRCTASSAE